MAGSSAAAAGIAEGNTPTTICPPGGRAVIEALTELPGQDPEGTRYVFFFAALMNPRQLFTIRGGVHPEFRKFLTAERPIETMPIPSIIRVPLQQHSGAPAVPLVARGDTVLKGQLTGKARGAVSANIRAPPPEM